MFDTLRRKSQNEAPLTPVNVARAQAAMDIIETHDDWDFGFITPPTVGPPPLYLVDHSGRPIDTEGNLINSAAEFREVHPAPGMQRLVLSSLGASSVEELFPEA
jgi:hypothetical protein